MKGFEILKIGIYPGSFDPVTNGHLDIISRSSGIVDKLIVAILYNPNKSNTLFTIEERVCLLEETTKHFPNVEIDSFSGLLVDYIQTVNANVIFRGLRAVTDFEYEMQMAQINKKLCSKAETLFMATSADYSFLSSSVVRELAYFGASTIGLVPDIVQQKIKEKY